MVSELGLRYAPSGAADRDGHAAKFMLLANDLADVDPAKLCIAIDRWVSFNPFPPKASELLAIIESIGDGLTTDLQHWCDERNAWAKRLGVDWWYRVTKRQLEDGSHRREVEKLEGFRAIEARAWAERRPIKAWEPKPGEVEAIHANVRKCIERGMTQAEFNRLVDSGRA